MVFRTEDNEKQHLATLKQLKRSVVGEKTKTGEGGHQQTPQVGRGDGRRKKSKTGE